MTRWILLALLLVPCLGQAASLTLTITVPDAALAPLAAQFGLPNAEVATVRTYVEARMQRYVNGLVAESQTVSFRSAVDRLTAAYASASAADRAALATAIQTLIEGR